MHGLKSKKVGRVAMFLAAFAVGCSGSEEDAEIGGWRPISSAGAPVSRSHAVIVWTGSVMLVWGGVNERTTEFGDGASYDPDRDRWRPVAEVGAPEPREAASGVWTGNEVLIWGGGGERVWDDGGRYDPVSDAWTPIGPAPGVEGRYWHHAAWTGAEMLIWGGFDESAEPVVRGWRFDPAAEGWAEMSQVGAPEPSLLQESVWSGTELLVWTVILEPYGIVGHAYRPESDEWRELSSDGVPLVSGPEIVWLGDEMMLWGDTALGVADGALYDPDSDRWRPMNGARQPKPRLFPAVVRYGEDAVVWGGDDVLGEGELRDGGIYDRSADAWTRIEAPEAVSSRSEHAAVSTGSEVIFWGGWDGSKRVNDGAIFVPPLE